MFLKRDFFLALLSLFLPQFALADFVANRWVEEQFFTCDAPVEKNEGTSAGQDSCVRVRRNRIVAGIGFSVIFLGTVALIGSMIYDAWLEKQASSVEPEVPAAS